MYRYFKQISGVGSDNYIYFWKSKGFSDENITAPNTSDYKFIPELSYYGTKTRVEFSGSCLRQNRITYDHRKIVNIYIVYEISKNFNISSYSTLGNCLLGGVSLTKNGDIVYGYGLGFDRYEFFTS